jgi:hypothetical protein
MRRPFQPPACRQDAWRGQQMRRCILMLVFIWITKVGVGFGGGAKITIRFQSWEIFCNVANVFSLGVHFSLYSMRGILLCKHGFLKKKLYFSPQFFIFFSGYLNLIQDFL